MTDTPRHYSDDEVEQVCNEFFGLDVRNINRQLHPERDAAETKGWNEAIEAAAIKIHLLYSDRRERNLVVEHIRALRKEPKP